MKRLSSVLLAIAAAMVSSTPASAATTVYPASICVPTGGTEVDYPSTRGGVRLLEHGSLICAIPRVGASTSIQRGYVRIRRGDYFGPIMFTLWAFDSFGNLTDAAQGRVSTDHRGQHRSYAFPIRSEIQAASYGYYLIDLQLNQGDEVVSIRIDDSN